MTARKRMTVAAAVLTLGVLAALPFLRREPIAAAPEVDDAFAPGELAAVSARPAAVRVESPSAPQAALRPETPVAPLPGVESPPAGPFAAGPFAGGETPVESEDEPPPTLADDFQPRWAELRRDRERRTPAVPARPRRHRIADGDTLEAIAREHYRDASLAAALYEANRERLPGRDLLPLGTELELPPREALLELRDGGLAPVEPPASGVGTPAVGGAGSGG